MDTTMKGQSRNQLTVTLQDTVYLLVSMSNKCTPSNTRAEFYTAISLAGSMQAADYLSKK